MCTQPTQKLSDYSSNHTTNHVRRGKDRKKIVRINQTDLNIGFVCRFKSANISKMFQCFNVFRLKTRPSHCNDGIREAVALSSGQKLKHIVMYFTDRQIYVTTTSHNSYVHLKFSASAISTFCSDTRSVPFGNFTCLIYIYYVVYTSKMVVFATMSFAVLCVWNIRHVVVCGLCMHAIV